MIGFDLIKNNELTQFKEYLKYGDILILDEYKNSLLGYAIKMLRFDFVILLLENELMDLNHKNINNDSIMHIACKTNNYDMVNLINRYNIDKTIKNNQNLDVISYAIYNSNYDIFKLLYDNRKNKNDLFLAAKYFNSGIFKLVFLVNKNFLNDKDLDGNTLLHIACKTNNYLLVDFLLNKNIKYYLKNNDLETPMFDAFRYSDILIIKKLVNYLPINSKNRYNESILSYASDEKKDLFLNQKNNLLFAVINESKDEILANINNLNSKIKNQAENILLDYNNKNLLNFLKQFY